MFKKILFYPKKHLVVAIPVILIIGFIIGMYVDTSVLKEYILFFTFFMIYPTMIGFKLKEAVDFSHFKVVGISMAINFIFIPLIAFILGRFALKSQPGMLAGLIMMSLFPTSGMTISWTMLNKGNVPAAVKITALSLILGSILAPWYLAATVGAYVQIDILKIFLTIARVVFLPLILGNVTFRLIRKKYSMEHFTKKIKPVLPTISVWSMLFIIFTSISLKAKVIASKPDMIIKAVLVLISFYLINFIVSTIVARNTLSYKNGIALVYGTVMRNLSIVLGIAVAFFGSDTAVIITLAFIIQVQGAAWYGKLSNKYDMVKQKPARKMEST